jgi:S1-C subfamily serine protease
VSLVAGVLGALLASGIGAASGEFGHGTTVVRPVKNVMGPGPVEATASAPTWPAIVDSLSPSIVQITANGDNGTTVASGVVWESQGDSSYILTDGDDLQGVSTVNVSVAGTSGTITGYTVGSDPMTGIAVVRVHGGDRARAPLGSLTDIRPGEPLAVLGAPGAAGNGEAALATGTVSELDCEVQPSTPPTRLGMINVSTMTPSPAGATVVEPTGAVVGVTIDTQPAGNTGDMATYAVPIDVADRVGSQIVSGSSVDHPWLGVVSDADLPSATASSLRLPGGAEVLTVALASPAARLGLEQGDTITQLGNTTITSVASLVLAINAARPGVTVPIEYLHQGKIVDSKVTLTNRPAQVVP